MTLPVLLSTALCASGASAPLSVPDKGKNIERPNILMIVCEDISPYLGCYGDPVAVSPNLDKFSTQAVRHTAMFTCVGVSSPSRYSLISGRYSSVDGANYMRVNKFIKDYGVVPPAGVKCYPEFMRRAGYYCTNNAKTDYQFPVPDSAWDEQGTTAHWKHAPENMPFFAIFNLNVTHESYIWKNTDKPLAVDPAKVPLPPYYPDTPTVRHDVAVMYSNIAEMDRQFQELLSELENSPRADNTIVIFYSDNGGPLPRGKREILDSGTLVPFMIRFPDGRDAGTVCDRLNMFIDIPATVLSLSGIRPPSYMHGQAMYGEFKARKARKWVFGATDRFDEQVEKRASIRDTRYLYVRNYMPQQSIYRPVEYRLDVPMMKEMVQMYNDGLLNTEQSLWFNAPAAPEELYDCVADPHQVHNLASDPAYASVLKKMKKAFMKEWIDKYNSVWERETEDYYIERSWPGGKKQVCPEAQVRFSDGRMYVDNDSSVYSALYRKQGDKKWHLYISPVPVKKGEKVEVEVERIGFTSSVNSYKVN